MSKLVIFSNAYGVLITDDKNDLKQKPNPFYQSVNEYLENGWDIVSVTGTGIASANGFNRGSFCFVIEKLG